MTMNFFKRAITSVQRRPGKSLILLLLVFVLGTIISGAISVGQAVGNTETALRRRLPAIVSLESDWEAMEEESRLTGEWPRAERLTPEMIRTIAELPQVSHYDYSLRVWELSSNQLQRYESDTMGGGMWRPGPDDRVHLDVRGVQNPRVIDIEEGLINLVDGRVFTEQEVTTAAEIHPALISREFAQVNNLSLNSFFDADVLIWNWDEGMLWAEDHSEENIFASATFTFEVIGIFEPVIRPDQENDHDAQWRIQELQNRIYSTNLMAEAVQRFQHENHLLMAEEAGVLDEILEWESEEFSPWFDNMFVLHDPLDIEAFREEAMTMLPQFWLVADLSNAFSDISNSMETLQWIASLVLWVSVGATLLILSLLITLFLRDRKHEIGIYLALGEKKGKVISQIMLEVVVISAIGVTLALFTGNLLSSGISQTMLRNDLANQSDDHFGMGGGSNLEWMFGVDFTQEEMLESYSVSLDATTILIFYGVGLGTVMLSTIVPILYVTSLDPKKIMM